MFQIKTNKEIGTYLSDLIKTRGFDSTRQFGKACLELSGVEPTNEELRKMSNRLSQIKQGKKAIQTYDLPIFTHLLNVSSEEILSAGTHFLPYEDRMTNYKFAASKDRGTWEEYINREDAVILNTDEYGKTFLDYALEFENYDLIKYLMDKGYIWFDGGDKKRYICTFGAGTSIKPKSPLDFGQLIPEIGLQDELRKQIIVMAIKNQDYDMLDKLRARETPELYMADGPFGYREKENKFDNHVLVEHVAHASDNIIDYFSREFEVISHGNQPYHYMFPYMNDLVNTMIKEHHEAVDVVLKRCKKHNEKIYQDVLNMLNETKAEFARRNEECGGRGWSEEDAIDTFQNYYEYNDKNDFITILGAFLDIRLATNLIKITATATKLTTKQLILEINELHEKILELKTSKEV